MGKKMQVLVVFEFDEVDDIESDKADEIIQSITQTTDEWTESFFSGHRPNAVWVEEVFMDTQKWTLAEEM
jgi:hypothetical protein